MHRIKQLLTQYAMPQDAPKLAAELAAMGVDIRHVLRLHLGRPAQPQFGRMETIAWKAWRQEMQQNAYKVVEQFIRRERAMREHVFARQPKKLEDKLRECDRALEALAALAPIPDAEQPGLFDKDEAQGSA